MVNIYHSEIGWNWNDERTTIPACAVIQSDPVTQFSGILDARGNKLMVTLQSEPAGFIIFPEK